jgi:hypothetical protein
MCCASQINRNPDAIPQTIAIPQLAIRIPLIGRQFEIMRCAAQINRNPDAIS